jgi:hypothetical protein
MHNRVVVVALDLHIPDINPSSYSDKFEHKLSAAEKIARFKQYIKAGCEELKKTNPNAAWIFVWREYGLTEKDSRFVSDKVKNDFLTEMRDLTSQYKQLIVIGGTMAHEVKVTENPREYLTQVRDKYKSYAAHIHAEEKKDKDNQIERQLAKIDKKLEEEKFDSVRVLRNSAFFIQGADVQQHDKTASCDETKNMNTGNDDSELFWSPGDATTGNTLFTLKDPDGHPFEVAAEICREHKFDVAKLKAEEAKTTPLIHFVLAEDAKLNLNSTCGVYTVPLDVKNTPKLILSDKVNDTNQVTLYQMDMLAESPQLRGPLKPLYPFEKRVLELLDDIIKKIPKTHAKYQTLQEFKKEFLSEAQPQFWMVDNFYECIIKYLDKLKTASPSFGQSVRNLFRSPDQAALNLQKFVAMLDDMLKTEMDLRPAEKGIYKDYLDRRDTPVMTVAAHPHRHPE